MIIRLQNVRQEDKLCHNNMLTHLAKIIKHKANNISNDKIK